MNNKTLVKIAASEGSFSFRTVSRSFHSPHRFYILKRELLELEERKHILSTDINSFAKLSLHHADNENPIMEISFFWLKESGGNILSGHTETIRLPYNTFQEYALANESMESKEWNMLSLSPHNNPQIEFKSRNNLRSIVNNHSLRHKLGQFLNKNFRWLHYQRIVLSDDYLPYSFLFTGYTSNGSGTCGAVILHQKNPDDIKTAYYSIHT